MITKLSSIIHSKFQDVEIDHSWAFADKTRKHTAYITHGYHRYPAKFIPQLAGRLIKEHSSVDDLVIDPFCGCGTTVVESKVLGRRSMGVDINPVAIMMSQAKKTAIQPDFAHSKIFELMEIVSAYSDAAAVDSRKHSRIDYWFRETEKHKLAYLLELINSVPYEDMRNFLLCGFSHILKNCSIWLQKSNKPTRDFKKQITDPFFIFSRHIKGMLRGNADFFDLLTVSRNQEVACNVHRTDARTLPTGSNSAKLIVTSPPYVTSYEYADLHQLTAWWFEYADCLPSFRKDFIGTAHHESKTLELNSEIAEHIVDALNEKSGKVSREVGNYFGEMNQVFGEMRRVLTSGGKTCIVIGNTSLKGVNILNAEVFVEQLIKLGFDIEDIIKREIPSKNLPSKRDSKSGRFTKASNRDMVLAYPTEFILIMRKL